VLVLGAARGGRSGIKEGEKRRKKGERKGRCILPSSPDPFVDQVSSLREERERREKETSPTSFADIYAHVAVREKEGKGGKRKGKEGAFCVRPPASARTSTRIGGEGGKRKKKEGERFLRL